jgi:hypothetical protein
MRDVSGHAHEVEEVIAPGVLFPVGHEQDTVRSELGDKT